ncbi:MAG: hypothetical protein IKZ94_02565 [Lachnospiraceae bacterium]|nr:hypothetical protein [Lachnospiraceae bacterium]
MKIKRLLSRLSLTLAAVMAVTMIGGMSVKAAESDAPQAKTYIVTFHPGNVGNFGDLNEVIAEYKAKPGVVDAIETKHKAIKLEVLPGTDIEAAPDVYATDNYYFLQVWSEPVETTVTKNADYTPNFGRLVDAVEYQVRFIIKGTETNIRPIYVTKANKGENIEYTAPTVVTVSAGARYFLQGEAKKTITLDEDATKNIITFEYVLEGRSELVSEGVVTTDGGTVTTVEGGTVVAGAPAAGGGGAAPAAVAPQAAEAAAPEVVNIDQGPAALAAGIPEGGEETTEITEPETPLDANLAQNTNLPYLILTAALVAVVGALFVVYSKKARKATDDGNEE